MKIAITGTAGLFGHGLTQVFSERHTVFPLTRADADITRREQIRSVLLDLKPDVVVHSAAIPDLDICELDPAKGFLVNFHGVRHVLEAARDAGAGLAHISSDAVFDGKKQSSYTEDDPTIPPTVYGRLKVRAEELVKTLPRHWIFRVSVLFGPGKKNFVENCLRKIQAGQEAVVAADQMGSATYTIDAARKIMELVELERTGLYHLSNQGACSRLDLARRAAELAGLDPAKVRGLPSDRMSRPAARLKYAVMEMAALRHAGIELPRPWPEALAEYVRNLRAQAARR